MGKSTFDLRVPSCSEISGNSEGLHALGPPLDRVIQKRQPNGVFLSRDKFTDPLILPTAQSRYDTTTYRASHHPPPFRALLTDNVHTQSDVCATSPLSPPLPLSSRPPLNLWTPKNTFTNIKTARRSEGELRGVRKMRPVFGRRSSVSRSLPPLREFLLTSGCGSRRLLHSP